MAWSVKRSKPIEYSEQERFTNLLNGIGKAMAWSIKLSKPCDLIAGQICIFRYDPFGAPNPNLHNSLVH